MIKIMLTCLIAQALSQEVTSSANEQCGIVNNNFYYGNDADSLQRFKVAIGPPGKKGPQGEKGSRGEPGVKGGSIITADQKIQLRKQVISEPLPRTCGDLEGYKTGFYWIAPDPFVLQPAYVFCNFTTGKALTSIGHDSLNEMRAEDCEEHGCYKHKITYGVEMGKIKAIIAASNHCRQYIKFRCNGAVLLYFPKAAAYGWWESRDGAKMLYWGGATSHRDRYCACGETGSCHNPANLCNCDHNSSPELSDEGYLDDKEVLPVTKLAFGDMGGASEKGWHTVGPLECW